MNNYTNTKKAWIPLTLILWDRQKFHNLLFSDLSILINSVREVHKKWVYGYIELNLPPFIRLEIHILALFFWSLIFILCQELMQRWIFWSFLKVGEFNLIYSSRAIETFEISSYKARKKRHYLGTSSFLRGIHIGEHP